MDKVVNPWTGKNKQKGEGLLNTLIEKHFPQATNTVNNSKLEFEERLLKMMEEKIKPKNKIGEYKSIFQVQERISKINEILEWLQKVERDRKNSDERVEAENIPIDSSFVYLPLHSSTIFHQILKQSMTKDKIKIVDDNQLVELKKGLAQIKLMKKMNGTLEKAIL